MKSCKNHGTLGYFCSMLGRMPNANDPKKDMNACTDALFTVLKGHYVACACKILQLQDPTAKCPSVDALEGKSKTAKLAFLAKLSLDVVNKFSIIEDAILGCKIYGTKDDAYDYASVFCHFASLALEFKNAWEEGDGDRVVRCWKFFMLHFRANSTRSKYAWEALRLQFQLVHLPPILSHQLRWERFVNLHGGKGNNIPCDLHNEHMNKAFKEIVSHLGANLNEKTAHTAARSVTTLSKIKSVFDEQSGISPPTVQHSRKSEEADVNAVAGVLLKNEILEVKPTRKWGQMNVDPNPLGGLNWDNMGHWIEEKKDKYLMNTRNVGEGDQSCEEASDIDFNLDSDSDF